MRRLSIVLAATALLTLVAAAPASARLVTFSTQTKNIGCAIDTGGVRCDIAKRTWKPPRKPKSCDLDYGQGLSVGKRGRGRFVCAGDTALGFRRIVGYGDSVTQGRFSCAVRRSDVRCRNSRTRHGFSLSKTRYRRF